MNIIEATKKALQTSGVISRVMFIDYFQFDVVRLPVGIYDLQNPKSPVKNWNPTADDVLADDWVVIADPEASPESLSEHDSPS